MSKRGPQEGETVRLTASELAPPTGYCDCPGPTYGKCRHYSEGKPLWNDSGDRDPVEVEVDAMFWEQNEAAITAADMREGLAFRLSQRDE